MKAWAKINLTLDILGKRPDAYHNLASVMQSLCLHDTLVIQKHPKQGLIKLICEADLPPDEGNLVYRAAQLLLSEYNILTGLTIKLDKKIPIAAGLAGGSSDCAAALLGINTLLDLGLSQKQLLDIGRKLGADVPFCLMSGASGATALAEGIGDILTPIPCHPKVSIVLVHPRVFVSTKDVFSAYTACEKIGSNHKSADMLKALTSRKIDKVATSLGNELASTAIAMHPEIGAIITALQKQKALGVNMSGSGPTVFAYFSSEKLAQMAINYIRHKFPDCDTYCTKPKN